MARIDYQKIDFISEIYPKILERLAKKELHYTKTRSNPNWVNLTVDIVSVKTTKNSPNFEEIPIEFFVSTWNLLVKKGEVTQSELSKDHNIKRSAFMLIAFDLLDIVDYIPSRNAHKQI